MQVQQDLKLANSAHSVRCTLHGTRPAGVVKGNCQPAVQTQGRLDAVGCSQRAPWWGQATNPAGLQRHGQTGRGSGSGLTNGRWPQKQILGANCLLKAHQDIHCAREQLLNRRTAAYALHSGGATNGQPHLLLLLFLLGWEHTSMLNQRYNLRARLQPAGFQRARPRCLLPWWSQPHSICRLPVWMVPQPISGCCSALQRCCAEPMGIAASAEPEPRCNNCGQLLAAMCT